MLVQFSGHQLTVHSVCHNAVAFAKHGVFSSILAKAITGSILTNF